MYLSSKINNKNKQFQSWIIKDYADSALFTKDLLYEPSAIL